ncbi:hypothetical protein [Bartonella raoultii]|uniref:hypothetical protein n=1 Tax=Bartonella raoultii TaxID=1457020 RepID=UPI001FF07C35|nr:hypothetical protein [Bartonella raoultii]
MALFPFSIADIDDPEHIRVVLYASGRMGHAPLNALLKQVHEEMTQISQRLDALEKQLSKTDLISSKHQQDVKEEDKNNKVSTEAHKAESEINVQSSTVHEVESGTHRHDFGSAITGGISLNAGDTTKWYAEAETINSEGNKAESGMHQHNFGSAITGGIALSVGDTTKWYAEAETINSEGNKAESGMHQHNFGSAITGGIALSVGDTTKWYAEAETINSEGNKAESGINVQGSTVHEIEGGTHQHNFGSAITEGIAFSVGDTTKWYAEAEKVSSITSGIISHNSIEMLNQYGSINASIPDVDFQFAKENKHVSLESGIIADIDLNSTSKLCRDDMKNFKVESAKQSTAGVREKAKRKHVVGSVEQMLAKGDVWKKI